MKKWILFVSPSTLFGIVGQSPRELHVFDTQEDLVAFSRKQTYPLVRPGYEWSTARVFHGEEVSVKIKKRTETYTQEVTEGLEVSPQSLETP